MTAFESVFALFGLVLGLAIADILACFARALESRRSIRLGWLTPLLGLLVLLDLTTYWALAWMFRDQMPLGLATLFGALLFSCLYYLAAYRVFPSVLVDGTDLDEHFFEVRRFVVGLLLVARLLELVLIASVPEYAPSLTDPFTIGTFALAFGLFGLILAIRNRTLLVTLLLLLILSYLGGAVVAELAG